MSGQGNVIQDTAPTGHIPASSIAVLSDDSKYLFKMGQKAPHHNVTAYSMYAAVLSGTRQQVNEVINQSQNNTYDYTEYDPNTYSGPCKGPVEAFYAGTKAIVKPPHRP